MTLPACVSTPPTGSFSSPLNPPRALSVFCASTSALHNCCYLLTFWEVRAMPQALQDPQAQPQFLLPLSPHGTAQRRVEASVDTGVGAQGEELSPDLYGRYGPGGVSFSRHLPPSLPSLRLGQAECHQPAPPLPKAAGCSLSGARVEGDRTSPRSVDHKVIIQGDETELSGVS